MKPSEIQLGKCYTNGKEVRRAIQIHPASRYIGQQVFYNIYKRNGLLSYTIHDLIDFASWATHEVPCPEEG